MPKIKLTLINPEKKLNHKLKNQENKMRRKKRARKNPAVTPAVNPKKRRYRSRRNPFSTPTGQGIFEVAVDGAMVAGSGIVTRLVPAWLSGFLPTEKSWAKYLTMGGVTFILPLLLRNIGLQRVAKNFVLGGMSAITLEALQEFFPQWFGEQGKFNPKSVKTQMPNIVVNPQGQLMLKGDDGTYTEISGQLTPEELAKQQATLALSQGTAYAYTPAMTPGGDKGADPGGAFAGAVELEGEDEEYISGNYVELEGQEDYELEGLNDFSYRNRINQFQY
jgi:hypothetical protein